MTAAKKGKPDMNRAEVYCNIHRRWNCRWKCPIQPKRKAWRPSDESVYAALRVYYPTIKSLSALPKACFTDMRLAMAAGAKKDGITIPNRPWPNNMENKLLRK